MTLTEFLLARIAEDEEVAQWAASDRRWDYNIHNESLYEVYAGTDRCPEHDIEGSPNDCDDNPIARLEADFTYERTALIGFHIARHDPARVLAECAAKRRIVDRIEWAARVGSLTDSLLLVAQCLAHPYADHPDFDPEWRLADEVNPSPSDCGHARTIDTTEPTDSERHVYCLDCHLQIEP